jgi:putative FmdB family regulatory protein
MPTYEYVCKTCGDHLEAVQSFHDEALTTCPRCSGELKKVFGSVGIVFKGSGFYKNDSRKSSSSSSTSESKSEAPAKTETAAVSSASSSESSSSPSSTSTTSAPSSSSTSSD